MDQKVGVEPVLEYPTALFLSYRDSYKLLFCYERGEFSLGVNEKVEKEKYFRKKKQASFLYPYCPCFASAREWAKDHTFELQRKLFELVLKVYLILIL